MNISHRSLLSGFVAIAALLAPLTPALGQTLITDFQFTSASDFSSSVTADIATVSTIVNSAGGSISAANQFYFRSDVSNAIPTSLDGSITAGTYIGFTVTPTDLPLTFETMGFDFSVSNATSLASYTVSWGVFASGSGFTADDILATGSLQVGAQSGVIWKDPAPSITLSSVTTLQAVDGPTEFRIYIWDDYATGNSNLVTRFDNIQLTATAVPEPAAYAMLFAAMGLGMAALRRRRRTS